MVKDYRFAYGSSSVSVSLNDRQVLGVIEGNKTQVLTDIRGALFDSLEHPVQSETLRTLAKRAGSIVLIVSDMTRIWMHQDLVIPHLVDYLVSICGKKYSELEIVVANGTHAPGSEDDLRTIVTPAVFDSVRVVNHCCTADDLVYLGTTDFKTPVWINHDAAKADLVICLGAATYHVMAGFGGGRKSILPGISGLDTVKHNHAFSLAPNEFKTNPAIGNGVLEGNPLNEDMCQAASLMKNLFMVNIVTDTSFNISSLIAGHWKKSWEKACEEVHRIYSVPIKEKADVVITSCGGFPKDVSLYQGTKSVDNVVSAVKDGGTIILFLEGREGGGSPDYFSWIDFLGKKEYEKQLREHFTVGGYIFFLNCEQAAKYRILMYSSIPSKTVAPMGIKAYSDINMLMKDASLEGKSVYVIPNGSTVLPEVRNVV